MSGLHRRPGLVLLLAGLTMFGPLAIDTMFPAFPEIGAELEATPLALQQLLSVYLAAYTLMALLHGPLSDALGRRPVILTGCAIFALASLGCMQARTLQELLLMRALQGMSAGAGMIVGRAVVRDLYEGPRAQRVMALMTMLFAVAPALAPVIGGWILGLAGWRAIFGFLALFAGLLLLACALRLPETLPPPQRQSLRPLSLLAGYAEILGHRGFRWLALAATFNFGALFLYVMSAPAVVFGLLGLDRMQFWVLFVPVVVGMIAGSVLSGRLAGRRAASSVLALAYALMGVAALAKLASSVLAPGLLPWAVLPLGLLACGIALAFPVLTLLMLDLFPSRRGAAASMQTAISLGIYVAVAGLLAPLVFDAAIKLALSSAGFSVAGWLCWRFAVTDASIQPLLRQTAQTRPAWPSARGG